MTQRNPIALRRRLIAGGVIRRTPANAAAARIHRLEQLHKLCDADYGDATPQRAARSHRDDAHLCAYAAEAVGAQ